MRRSRLMTVTLAALLTLAACSGGSEAGGEEVASLDGDAATTTTEPDSARGGSRFDNAEFEDAMVEFAECMRDHGVDFPDPQTDGSGAVIIGPGEDGEMSAADLDELEAAQEACQPILDEVQDSLPQPSPEEEAEFRERALEFAECMRDHGIDMPDPTFGEGGGFGIELEGDRGIDPSDPDFQEAQEACMGDMRGPGFGFDFGGGDEGDEGDADDDA
jgi:hypothetical protein